MSILSLFILISAIAATYSILREEILLRVMNLIIFSGLSLLVFKVPILSTIGLAAVVLTILGFVFYVSKRLPYSQLGNAAIIVCATSSSIGPAFRVMHWPGGNAWTMLGAIGVVLGVIWYLYDAKKDEKNLSPFILLIPYCLVSFIQFFNY